MTDEFARSRLDILANNCAAKLTSLYAPETFSAGGSFDDNGRKISFSPSWGYMREFHIIARFGHDNRLTGITLSFWPGNNAVRAGSFSPDQERTLICRGLKTNQ